MYVSAQKKKKKLKGTRHCMCVIVLLAIISSRDLQKENVMSLQRFTSV